MLKIILRLGNNRLSIQLNKLTRLVLLCMAFFSSGLVAQENKFSLSSYGDELSSEPDKFFYFDELEGVLFLNGDIEEGMYTKFRQAIAENKIHTIVLNSLGGNVQEGLNIAGTVFDKKIKTYIPIDNKCNSACSFIFFGGSEKYALGELGVHQAAYDDDISKEKVAVGVVKTISQIQSANILLRLGEFNTPRFVEQRMLRTAPEDMYIFNKKELDKLGNLNVSEKNKIFFKKIDNFMNELKLHYAEIDCDKDISKCTPAQICLRAANNNLWKTTTISKKYVIAAKGKGLTCGVPVPVCPEDIKKCNKKYLCKNGTTSLDASLSWLNNSFADEAKSRGYLCGIVSKPEIKKQTCSQNFKVCNREELCKFATKGSDNNTSWETNIFFKKHVAEAKRLRLNCGVKINSEVKKKSCSDDINTCTLIQLCTRGTRKINSKIFWATTSYFKKYSVEAKRRGLSCGVTTQDKKKTCYQDTEECTYTQLCTLITLPSSERYITEVKKRGLSCGASVPVCPEDLKKCNKEFLCKNGTTKIYSGLAWLTNTFAYEAKSRGLRCGVITQDKDKNDKITIIRNIQNQLNTLGCDAGSVDGILGSKTLSALMRWKARGGIYTVNKVDEALLNKLNKTSVKCRRKGASLSAITGITERVSYVECKRTYISDKSGKYLDRLTKKFVFAYTINSRKYSLISNNIIYVPALGNKWRKLTKYQTPMDYQNSPLIRAGWNDGKYPRRLTYSPKRNTLKVRVSKNVQGKYPYARYVCKSFVP